MADLPAVGTRVSLRYRRPEGSVPPLTDVIGHLLETGRHVRVQTKTGAVVDIARDDVVAVRALTAAPVRTSQIRATEHAAALAWPGTEQQWMAGWLLRGAGGHTHRANSAVPLGVEADTGAVPAIIEWYSQRGQTPWLAVADRLLPLPKGVPAHLETVVMVRDLPAGEPDATVVLAPRPDEQWLAALRTEGSHRRVDRRRRRRSGVRSRGDAAVGRAAVTAAPDGTPWAGLSAVRVADGQRAQRTRARHCVRRCWPGPPSRCHQLLRPGAWPTTPPRSHCMSSWASPFSTGPATIDARSL